MKILLITFLLALIYSCSPKTAPPVVIHDRDSITSEKTDSNTTAEIDTNKVAPVEFTGKVNLDSLCEARYKTSVQDTVTYYDTIPVEKKSILLKVSGNTLTVTCKTDSLEQVIYRLTTVIKKERETRVKEKDVIIPPPEIIEKKLTKFQTFRLWFFWIVVAFIGGGVAWKFRKFIPVLKYFK